MVRENALTAIGVSGGLDEIKADAHDPAPIFFGDFHVLQKPDRVPDNGDMNISSGQVVQKRFESAKVFASPWDRIKLIKFRP
jgi:hypothetical protein